MIGYKLVRLPDYSSMLASGRYIKYYIPGTTVVADPHTSGLMIFSSLGAIFAGRFISAYKPIVTLCVQYSESDIIPVDYICRYVDQISLDSYYASDLIDVIDWSMPPPLGTICCSRVGVLKPNPT